MTCWVIKGICKFRVPYLCGALNKTMKYMEKKNIKCYNSGKIGGLSYLQAYKNFENADQEIAAMGFTPVNPIIL